MKRPMIVLGRVRPDPVALPCHQLFEPGWNVTLVPLDVTMANVLEENHRREMLASAAPVPRALGEMLGFYYRFYEDIFGRPCSAMHEPLAAVLAVGGVKASVAPVVRAAADASSGPGRGQTICDMRGAFMGYPSQSGARCRVVLAVEGDFAAHLVKTLLTSSERTTAALASAGSVA